MKRTSLDLPSAFYEDELRWIRFSDGGPVARQVMPCTRCIFTTVDPHTGLADKKMEPLKTLRTFRTSADADVLAALGDSPFFGVNLALEGDLGASIRVGDDVFQGE